MLTQREGEKRFPKKRTPQTRAPAAIAETQIHPVFRLRVLEERGWCSEDGFLDEDAIAVYLSFSFLRSPVSTDENAVAGVL